MYFAGGAVKVKAGTHQSGVVAIVKVLRCYHQLNSSTSFPITTTWSVLLVEIRSRSFPGKRATTLFFLSPHTLSQLNAFLSDFGTSLQ